MDHGKMKCRIVCLLLLFAAALAGCAAGAEERECGGCRVWLPDSYEAEQAYHYPVLYLLPEDGYRAEEDSLFDCLTGKIGEGQGMEMIIVRPAFTKEDDIPSRMREMITQIDETFRTVPDPSCRIAAGTGTGGYLAYTLLLEEEGSFGAAASIRGNFAGDDNPWLAVYGSVMEKMQARSRADQQFFNRVYTYMDAPVEDAWTDQSGSTDDLGMLMIDFGTGSDAHEYTVRPGAFDEAFAAESAGRLLNRMSGRILSGLAGGRAVLEKAALTKEDTMITASLSLMISEDISAFAGGEFPAAVTAALKDPLSGKVLSEETKTMTVPGPGEYPLDLTLAQNMEGSTADVVFSLQLMGFSLKLCDVPAVMTKEPVIDGAYQEIDLAGDWYFMYTGQGKPFEMAGLEKEEFETWSVVQPGFAWWTNGFGNISDETVPSAYDPDYFDYMITGNAYYARSFFVPDGFDTADPELSIGYVDDRCEVYLNGKRVGAVGMDERGEPDRETTWAVFSHFPVDPSLLRRGEENIVVVRAYNDLPYGAGGWYAGPTGLYSRTAFDALYGESGSDRFYEESFSSAWAAKAKGLDEPVENRYLIYLPEGYDESDRFYPTLYLFHQYNSDHTSYRSDHVDELLDQGIREGLFDDMVVVIPNSDKESWWVGDWQRMITEELIPHIESKYRVISDARYRFTAGCSMGGQGAFAVALRNPDYFSGAVSFFGAFSYGGANDPAAIAQAQPEDYLKHFALFFICGNQDVYGFGKPAVRLHRALNERGVEHGFFIENGEHNSEFYVPYFTQGISYARRHMYQSDGAAAGLLSGSLRMEDGEIVCTLQADPAISSYLYTVPDCSYVESVTQPLQVPLELEIWQDGEKKAMLISREAVLSEDQLSAEVRFPEETVKQYISDGRAYTLTLKAAVFDGQGDQGTVLSDLSP